MPAIAKFKAKDFTTRQIGHLGLVAGAIDELGITEVIEKELPKSRNHALSHSDIIKAMVLNGLGFNERRAYLFSRFFDNLATEQLFGPGITPDHFNDDVILRTLDSIYEYGSTDLFNKIVLQVMAKLEFGTHLPMPIRQHSASMATMTTMMTISGPSPSPTVITRTTAGISSNLCSRWSRTSTGYHYSLNPIQEMSPTGRSCSKQSRK